MRYWKNKKSGAVFRNESDKDFTKDWKEITQGEFVFEMNKTKQQSECKHIYGFQSCLGDPYTIKLQNHQKNTEENTQCNYCPLCGKRLRESE